VPVAHTIPCVRFPAQIVETGMLSSKAAFVPFKLFP